MEKFELNQFPNYPQTYPSSGIPGPGPGSPFNLTGKITSGYGQSNLLSSSPRLTSTGYDPNLLRGV